MKTQKSLFFFFLGGIFLLSLSAKSKDYLDGIVGKMGDKIILESEIQRRALQAQSEGISISKCDIMEGVVFEKLLLYQAEIDSIEISEIEVESQLSQRINYFVQQIGSLERLENYYGKPVALIKREFRETIKEQILMQKMQSNVVKEVDVSPSDVRKYYEDVLVDSSLLVNAQVVIKHITIEAPPNEASKKKTFDKISKYRERVLNGGDFGTLAVLYSEDKGSAAKRGELGFTNRNSLVPEYRTTAFNLEKDEISEVFETKYGYHFLQLIGRRGEQINTRHILLRPKQGQEELEVAKKLADSLYNEITSGGISFEDGALYYSNDKKTRLNGGRLINFQTNESTFDVDQLDSKLYLLLNSLEEGDLSLPQLAENESGESYYRIVKLEKKIKPHQINIDTDYQKVKELSLNAKQEERMKGWRKNKIKESFLKLESPFSECSFSNFSIN